MKTALTILLLSLASTTHSGVAHAGPETSLREFGSSQVKKGVRSLGMGGNGATFGNYSIGYRDASSAIADYGVTHFTDTGNDVHFVAVGVTTPKFWDGTAAIAIIALAEWGTGLKMHLKSPAFAKGADFVARSEDEAIVARLSKYVGRGISLGVQVGWEGAKWSGSEVKTGGALDFSTVYLPSAGFGATWHNRHLIVGLRGLLTNDWETRKDATSETSGWVRSWEFRAGIAVHPFAGTTIDAGWVGLYRTSAIDNTQSYQNAFVAGIEQVLWSNHLAIRAGWNESSPTAGLTVKIDRTRLDVAYVHNLGVDRTKGAFGNANEAVLATLNVDFSPAGQKHSRVTLRP